MELIDGVFTHPYDWCEDHHKRAKFRFFTFKDQYVDILKCETCGKTIEMPVSNRLIEVQLRQKLSIVTADLFDFLRMTRNVLPRAHNIEFGGTHRDREFDGKRIRLDFEVDSSYLTNEEMDDLGQNGGMFLGKAVWPLSSLFINDMVDLALHGDTESTDPLLKVLDGAYKTGINPDVKFGTFEIYKEFRPMKDTYELTMFTRIGL